MADEDFVETTRTVDDDKLQSMLTTTQQTIESLVRRLAERPDMLSAFRHLASAEDMLARFSELALIDQNLTRAVLQLAVASLLNAQSRVSIEAEQKRRRVKWN